MSDSNTRNQVTITETSNQVTVSESTTQVLVTEVDGNDVYVTAQAILNAGETAGVYTDTGAPDDSVGFDGDYYIDESTGELYGPKSGGAWPAVPTIPTTLIPSKYTDVIGDDVTSVFTITHNLNTDFVMVELYDANTYEEIVAQVDHVSANEITITFSSPPAVNEIAVIVFGV